MENLLNGWLKISEKGNIYEEQGKIKSFNWSSFLTLKWSSVFIWHRYFKFLFDNMKNTTLKNLSKNDQENAIVKAKAMAQAMGQKI